MKADEAKSLQRVRFDACGCEATRTSGTSGPPMFQVTQPCDDHRDGFQSFMGVFVTLKKDADVTALG